MGTQLPVGSARGTAANSGFLKLPPAFSMMHDQGLVKHTSVNSDSLLVEFDFNGDFRIEDKPVFIDRYESIDDGTSLWDAGVVLGQYITFYKELYPGNCLELGSGTGFAGICRAIGCPETQVYLTDVEKIIQQAGMNVQMNELQDRVFTKVFDWEGECPWTVSAENTFPWDFVMASDVLWHRLLVDKFFKGLAKVTTPGMKAVLAHVNRSQNLYADIQAECAKEGFDVLSVTPSTEMELPHRGHSMCHIWILQKQKA
ncbi:unnamed protein product [Amoebophrya sp. A25]|nr:unnamed protein product [Amoebophrya sp. A25]|eukprot:GSA25T00017343001.1